MFFTLEMEKTPTFAKYAILLHKQAYKMLICEEGTDWRALGIPEGAITPNWQIVSCGVYQPPLST